MLPWDASGCLPKKKADPIGIGLDSPAGKLHSGAGEPAANLSFVALAQYDHWPHATVGQRQFRLDLCVTFLVQGHRVGLRSHGSTGGTAANHLPAFLALLDVGVEEPEWQRLHPTQRRSRTLDACKRLLLRESQVQPLVLIVEDLHWIDSETQAFLNSLIESLPTSRILLLVNFRPEYQSSWGSKTYYAQLRIDPLPAESAEELLLGLLGGGDPLRGLRQTLIQRTEGNPFFLEESVRSLVEAGVLAGERGNYRLQAPLASIQVPGRVQSVLAARIDRLQPEDKRLLQTAAVIGKDVPFPLLQVIAELPAEDLQAGLARLQAAEFLYEARLFPDIEYTFKHALTHEVAYSSLLQDRRRATHARIVSAMESLYAGRIAEQLERLSQHAVRGQVWPRAVTYLHQAGLKALARSANQEAVSYLDQALDALSQLPETRETTEQSIDLRLELRSALHPLGEFERVLESLQRAAGLAESSGDTRRQGRVFSYLAQSFRLGGDYTGAIEAGQKAIEIGRSFDDLGIQAPANFHLGQAFFHLGDHGQAAEFNRTTSRCSAASCRRIGSEWQASRWYSRSATCPGRWRNSGASLRPSKPGSGRCNSPKK